MRKLILFGAGNYGVKWLNKLGKDNVFSFADFNKDKIGKLIDGKKVLSIENIIEMKRDITIFISTSSMYKNEIENKLLEYGLEKCLSKTPYLDSQNYIDVDASIDIYTILEGNNAVWANTRIVKSYLGYGSFVNRDSNIINTKIGKYVSIGPNVKIIRGQHPSRKIVSTYPAFYAKNNSAIMLSYVEHDIFEELRYAEYPYSVVIGNDVWIGAEVNIMEGIKIADGTILAAGANVVNNTEPYSIVGGNPAKLIRYRFDEEEIAYLLNLKWWNMSEKWIKSRAQQFADISVLMRENPLDISE